MFDKCMGRLCRYAGKCPVYKGSVALKQPLFLVKTFIATMVCIGGINAKYMFGLKPEKKLMINWCLPMI